MFHKMQSVINYSKQKQLINDIISKYSFVNCCDCTSNSDCDIAHRVKKEYISRTHRISNTDKICGDGQDIYWDFFVRDLGAMETKESGGPCYGRTAIKILEESISKFGSESDVISLVKADKCTDGVQKTPEACKRAWRGDMCLICPLH